MEIVKELRIELLFDPAIPLLNIYSRGNKSYLNMCTYLFIAVHSKAMELTKYLSTEDWIKKCYIYMSHDETLLSQEKSKIMSLAAAWNEMEANVSVR